VKKGESNAKRSAVSLTLWKISDQIRCGRSSVDGISKELGSILRSRWRAFSAKTDAGTSQVRVCTGQDHEDPVTHTSSVNINGPRPGRLQYGVIFTSAQGISTKARKSFCRDEQSRKDTLGQRHLPNSSPNPNEERASIPCPNPLNLTVHG
jgi:hypothetical protein